MRDFTGAAELAQISPNVAGGLATLKNRTVVDSHGKAHAKLAHQAFDLSSIFPGIDSYDDASGLGNEPRKAKYSISWLALAKPSLLDK